MIKYTFNENIFSVIDTPKRPTGQDFYMQMVI